jgi:hypothetical protein
MRIGAPRRRLKTQSDPMPVFVLRLKAPRPRLQTLTDAERQIMARHGAHWRPNLEQGDMVAFRAHRRGLIRPSGRRDGRRTGPAGFRGRGPRSDDRDGELRDRTDGRRWDRPPAGVATRRSAPTGSTPADARAEDTLRGHGLHGATMSVRCSVRSLKPDRRDAPSYPSRLSCSWRTGGARTSVGRDSLSFSRGHQAHDVVAGCAIPAVTTRGLCSAPLLLVSPKQPSGSSWLTVVRCLKLGSVVDAAATRSIRHSRRRAAGAARDGVCSTSRRAPDVIEDRALPCSGVCGLHGREAVGSCARIRRLLRLE